MTKKGFTLIELLVVIAILAILMAVVVVTINQQNVKKNRDTKGISDLDALRLL
jgi:prepilin-type N-terminal cleavage/methylation domain-containing protein